MWFVLSVAGLRYSVSPLNLGGSAFYSRLNTDREQKMTGVGYYYKHNRTGTNCRIYNEFMTHTPPLINCKTNKKLLDHITKEAGLLPIVSWIVTLQSCDWQLAAPTDWLFALSANGASSLGRIAWGCPWGCWLPTARSQSYSATRRWLYLCHNNLVRHATSYYTLSLSAFNP